LGHKAIPQVEREVFVDTAKASNEVILEGADGAFGGIAAVDAGRGELEVNFLFAEELLQCFRAFKVETLKAGTQAGGVEFGMEGLKSGKDGGAHEVFDGFGKNDVAVEVVHEEQVIVAGAGRSNESAGLVTEEFSGWF
jgi:hypothetical protein